MTSSASLRRGHRWTLAAILAIALIARVGLVLATRPHYVPRVDPHDYDRLATSIADGKGYGSTNLARPGTPAALWPPGYPYLLAAVYVVRGAHAWTSARLLGALLGTVTVLLTFLIADAVAGKRTALVAAAIAAVFPPLIMLNASLISEALFVPLELASVLAVLAYRRGPPRMRWAVLCGVLCGLAALTRSVGLLLLIPAAIGLWSAAPTRRFRLLAPIVVVSVAAAVICPWTIRNAEAFHAFVPISTQGGVTEAGTYNSQTNSPGRLYAVWRPPYLVKQFAPLFARYDEVQLNNILGGDARRYALAHPGYAVNVTALNLLRSLDLGPGHTVVTEHAYAEIGIPLGLWRATTISAWVIVALATLGLVLGRRAVRLRHGFLWLVPIFMLATIPISSGNAERYRAPADPFLVLLAAIGILWLVDAARGARTRAATRPAGFEPATFRSGGERSIP